MGSRIKSLSIKSEVFLKSFYVLPFSSDKILLHGANEFLPLAIEQNPGHKEGI